MVYRLFYYLVKFTCYFYFKRIKICFPENKVKNGPLIICANHGNSFMDAILLAITNKRPLHFLVRADVFDTPFKKWFFNQLNMMPVYRIRDGRESLQKNEEVFKKCKHILENNGAIVIFPEGNCVVEKRLRPFKTGFAQLAFITEAPNLVVQAVAINYQHPERFKSDVAISYTQPISVNQIKEGFIQHEAEFSKTLLNLTRSSIQENLIAIPKQQEDSFYESVFEIIRNNELEDSSGYLKKQLDICEKLADIENEDEYKQLKSKVHLYFTNLKENQITDFAVLKGNKLPIKLGIWFPIYFTGFLINYPIAWFIENIIDQKIKDAQFKSSVRMVLGMFTYPIYLVLLSALVTFLLHNFLFIFIFSVICVLSYYRLFQNFETLFQQKKLRKQPDLLSALTNQREEIVCQINFLLGQKPNI